MAYVYQVNFAIRPEQMETLEIGASLERVLGYLRTLLPGEPGYITSRALYSLDYRDQTQLIFQSVWDRWEDLEQHRQAGLAENKVLAEFKPHLKLQDLDAHVYEEIA